MPEVVSNTTPLISLSKIAKLELLKSLYGKITIPRGVFEEYREGRKKEDYIDISKLDWIKVARIIN